MGWQGVAVAGDSEGYIMAVMEGGESAGELAGIGPPIDARNVVGLVKMRLHDGEGLDAIGERLEHRMTSRLGGMAHGEADEAEHDLQVVADAVVHLGREGVLLAQ